MTGDLVKSFYKDRWDLKKVYRFSEYERNSVLPEFFPTMHDETWVLDVACGVGIVSDFLYRRGYKVWGIDISNKAILAAKSLGVGRFRQGNIEEGLPYKSNYFDAIFLGDILEHVYSPQFLLKEVRRVLRNHGRIVLSCPNMGFWMYRWHYLRTGEVALTEGHKTTCWQTGHIRFYTVSSIESVLRCSGIKPIRIVGVNKSTIYTFMAKFFPSIFASIVVVEGKVKK